MAMSINKQEVATDFKEFENKLLDALKIDDDHHFELSKGITFYSEEFQCPMFATDVRYEPSRGELVLVGAFRKHQVLSGENGSLMFAPEGKQVVLPFDSVIKSMQNAKSYDPSSRYATNGALLPEHFLSEIRKSFVNKCIDQPISFFKSYGLIEGGIVDAKKLINQDLKLEGRTVSSFGVVYGESDRSFFALDADGKKLDYADCSLSELAAVGNTLRGHIDYLRQLRKEVCQMKHDLQPVSMTCDETSEQLIDSKVGVYLIQKGASYDVCRAITSRISNYNIFDEKFDRKEVYKRLTTYRDGTNLYAELERGLKETKKNQKTL